MHNIESVPRLNVFDPTRTQNHFPLPAPQPGASPKDLVLNSPMLDLLTNRTGFRYKSTQNMYRQTGKVGVEGGRRAHELSVINVSTLATLKKL